MLKGALLRAALALAAARAAAARASPARAERPTVLNPQLRDYGNTPIWPLPASALDAGCSATLDPASFAIIVAQPAADAYLLEVAARFLPVVLFNPAGTPSSRQVLANVTLTVLDPTVRQVQQGTDERYNLTFARDCSSAATGRPIRPMPMMNVDSLEMGSRMVPRYL
jgi:hypothetical protein